MNQFQSHLIEETEALLTELSYQNISMQLVAGNVKVFAKANTLSTSQLLRIRQNKEQIKEYLASKKKLPQIEPDLQARYQPFPLTDIQRAYWVGHQMDVELGDVSIHYYSEVLCATLDLDRFDAALQKTIARHDMLRVIVDEQGSQQILPEVPAYAVQVDDIRDLNAEQQQAWLEVYREERSHSTRSPGQFPGFDFSIVRLNNTQDVLYASVDLLHVDGGSLMILFDDLYRFYHNEQYSPEPISISYRDYALAELSIHQSALYKEGLLYWQNEVKHLPPAPDLPQRKTTATASRFVRHQFNISSAQGAMLKRQAAELKVTPTVFVMLAFAELLRKWNSGNDFTLNVTVFNRLAMHKDVNQLIGDFTSMLLIPVQHDQVETLSAKALKLQKKLWSSMKHRYVSGVRVLNELGQYTGNHGNVQMPVVFTSMLDLAGQGIPSNWLSGFGEERFTLTQTPQVSFDHQITQLESGEMCFSWDLIEHLFPPGMVADMFEVYEKLVIALIEKPEVWTQNTVNILPQRQLEVLAAANATQIDFGAPRSLLDLFQHSVARQPDAIALVDGLMPLSYRQLDTLSQQLAAMMLKVGIVSGQVVAIFMEKGWQQVVAALATHYCGCAYLPLDVEQPVQRLDYQLANSKAVAVLHQLHLKSQANALAVSRRIEVELDVLQQTTISLDELANLKPQPETLSHLIYTSGSTGKPKGVMVGHQQVVNRVLDINQRFNIGSTDAVIALTALHHDLSVYDLFGMLAAGGIIVLPNKDLRLDPAHWLDLVARHQVTLWNSVPAYLDILLDYLAAQPQAPAKTFKMFILAGDWIPVTQPKRVHTYWPEAQFVASGGPTETTIWDIYHLVDPNESFKESIPYGRPLANSQYKILDCHLNPCPTWVAGEMYISGAGVTAGYINQPELTAQRYVHLPGDETLYFKSGDLGRYLPDGQIEFIGRNDHQVKIRGLRIELPEIEAVAETLPDVNRAVALVKQTDQGPKLRLWVLSNALDQQSVATLIDFAGQESDFEASEMSVADVSERLTRKLEYRALQVATAATLYALPDVQHSHVHRLKSYREFLPRAMSQLEFSQMLALLRTRSESGELKCGYGSAGGLYPVQLYFHLKEHAVEGFAAGLYRYYPIQHAVSLVNDSQADANQHFNHNRATCKSAPIAMYFVLHEPTIVPQYGMFSAAMAYTEVGMIAQLLRSEGPLLNLGICQIGGLKDQAQLEQDLALSGEQKLLGSLLMGLIEQPHPQSTQKLSPADIAEKVRAQLSCSLPKYMVPDDIGVLAALPLTANGKVDRNALLAMDVVTKVHLEVIQPANELESILCETFKQIVGVDKVSTQERFFDMGANSALLVKIYHAFRQRVDIEFKLIEMFKHPTIAGLIANIAKDIAEPAHNTASVTELERLSNRRAHLKNLRSKG